MLQWPAIAAIGWVLASGSGGALAQDWASYGESEIGVYYYDPASLRTEGKRKRVWRLVEWRTSPRDGIHSGKALIEIDCKAGKYRYLKTLQYEGKMGQGKLVESRNEQPADFFAPGTMIGQLAQRVC